MPHPAPLPSSLPAMFSYGQARAVGASPRRLRALDLARPFRGMRAPAEKPPEPEDFEPGAIDRALQRALMWRVNEYECVRHPSSFYTGQTALGIHGLPFMQSEDAPLHVGVLLPARAPRMQGIRGTAFSPWLASVEVVEGVPVTRPTSTWALLAHEFGERRLTLLADAIIRIPRGPGGLREPHKQLASLKELHLAAMAPHRRHREKLLRALERARVGSMSVLESEFRLAGEDAGLPEPDLDVEIRDSHGQLVGIADIVYRKQRVIVEVEGDHHRTSQEQWNRDLAKHAAYAELGWEVVRVTAASVRHSDVGVNRVREALIRQSR